MQVDQIEGKWVVTDGGRIVGEFGSNAEAWRFIDRRSGDPTNRSERVTDWLWQQRLNGGFQKQQKRKARSRPHAAPVTEEAINAARQQTVDGRESNWRNGESRGRRRKDGKRN
jgi:hypothetical protein